MDDRTGDLESRLLTAGRAAVYPETPDLVPSVLAALPARRRRVRRPLVATAAAAVAILVVLGFPGPRRAVADLLGIGGVTITVVDRLPEADSLTMWGRTTTLAAAEDAVSFDLLLPAGFGEPDLVAIDDSVPGGLVTLGYGSGDGGYRVAITQLAGVGEPVLDKEATPAIEIVAVTVGDGRGLWIEGPPHVVTLRNPDGSVRADRPRLVANTLVYTDGERTVRIELAGSLDEALAVADLLR